ncbi:nucleotidyltransferase domain-containing protein [Chitinimonas sp.]|uniref:nucleotidyltransferase domain-containing protein n=1 Tax=Chitinimonas sp. TaxID=1934313 RepID=UPI0035B2AE3B
MTTRDRSPRGGAREQIIQLAARLMAEEHIDDFGLAKRKAIKRLGLPEGKNLPSNEELEIALREYRSLFLPDHGAELAMLRKKAIQAMQLFGEFKPYLVGSVLTGSAGPHSDINLVVYTDNDKAVEIRCLNLGLDYRSESSKAGYPTLAFYVDGSLVRLSIRPENEERHTARIGEAPERARLAQVEGMLLAAEV